MFHHMAISGTYKLAAPYLHHVKIILNIMYITWLLKCCSVCFLPLEIQYSNTSITRSTQSKMFSRQRTNNIFKTKITHLLTHNTMQHENGVMYHSGINEKIDYILV